MYNNYYDNMGLTRRALWLSTTENYALKNRGDAHKKKYIMVNCLKWLCRHLNTST